jgi:hypothetical protein
MAGSLVELIQTAGGSDHPRVLDEVKRRIEAGCDVNQADGHGLTPAMAAVLHPELQVLETLLAAGADVHRTDRSGCSALVHALRAHRGPDVNTTLHQVHTLFCAGARYPPDGPLETDPLHILTSSVLRLVHYFAPYCPRARVRACLERIHDCLDQDGERCTPAART